MSNLHIYGDRAIFLHFFLTNTMSLIHVKLKRSYLNQYSPINRYQRLYGTMVSKFYKMGGNIVVVLHIDGALDMFLVYCDHQDTKSESRYVEIGVDGPILSQKKPKSIYGTMVSILQEIG